MTAVVIENLTKYYGNFKALDGINLEVEEREIFGFLGPNGAGKSTTLNIILGLIRPSSGKVLVCGIDVEEKPLEVRKVCGYLPENYGLYGHMTGRQNLHYFAEFYDFTRDEIRKRTEELLELVGLSDAADRKVSEYSRGMRQRLALAQALINDPEVVFLDEPTNGLDPKGAAEFREVIRKLKSDGKTVFFSSHVLAEVKEVCETVGIIHRGKIVAKGRIDELSSGVRIAVQTVPEVDEEILKSFGKVSYDERSGNYIIEAERDCRVELSKLLAERGFLIKELHMMEPSLEEIYFSIVG